MVYQKYEDLGTLFLKYIILKRIYRNSLLLKCSFLIIFNYYFQHKIKTAIAVYLTTK